MEIVIYFSVARIKYGGNIGMRITKGVIVRIIFGLGLSFCISFMFMLIAQGLAGGFTRIKELG